MKESGKTVVKEGKYIYNSDLISKGEYLGNDNDLINDWIYKNTVYGEDSSGYVLVSRNGDYEPQEFKNIIDAILDEAGVDKIMVIDD